MRIGDDVLDVIGNSTMDGRQLVLPRHLDRPLYLRTDEVLRLAGGTWNRKSRAHLFDGDARDAIDPLLLTGTILRPQDFGFFPTPKPLVARLLDLADLEPGMSVLEPEAGRGAIAEDVARVAPVDCIELLPDLADTIGRAGYARSLVVGDFLAAPPAPIYDRVVMNPPFNRGADTRHVRHALGFLRPGGVLVAIMSAGIRFRTDRATAELRCRLDVIERNPPGSFKASGTEVNTVTVTAMG